MTNEYDTAPNKILWNSAHWPYWPEHLVNHHSSIQQGKIKCFWLLKITYPLLCSQWSSESKTLKSTSLYTKATSPTSASPFYLRSQIAWQRKSFRSCEEYKISSCFNSMRENETQTRVFRQKRMYDNPPQSDNTQNSQYCNCRLMYNPEASSCNGDEPKQTRYPLLDFSEDYYTPYFANFSFTWGSKLDMHCSHAPLLSICLYPCKTWHTSLCKSSLLISCQLAMAWQI